MQRANNALHSSSNFNFNLILVMCRKVNIKWNVQLINAIFRGIHINYLKAGIIGGDLF